jgi:hypothetical protein
MSKGKFVAQRQQRQATVFFVLLCVFTGLLLAYGLLGSLTGSTAVRTVVVVVVAGFWDTADPLQL